MPEPLLSKLSWTWSKKPAFPTKISTSKLKKEETSFMGSDIMLGQ